MNILSLVPGLVRSRAVRCPGALFALALPLLRIAAPAASLEFTVTYSGQTSRTWNWSDGSQDVITLSASGTVSIWPYQTSTPDGQSFVSSVADLVSANHLWGSAVQGGSAQPDTFDFDAPRSVSRTQSSTSSHFTAAGYLYFITEDSVYVSPDDITVYAWEYVSSEQVLRMWVALPDPFSFDSQYEHYDFPASHVVLNASLAHSSFLGSVVDPSGAAIPGAQVTLGGVAATSDANGAFQYDDIPPGTYDLTITKSGLNPVNASEAIPPFSILHKSFTMGCTAVSNVRAVQRPGTRLVDILYDLQDSGSGGALVSVQVFTNGILIPASHFYGMGYGSGVTAGSNRSIV